MATNAYKPSNRVVTEDQVARVETPGVKSIDEVAAFLNISEEQTIKTLVYIADQEPVVALLVGNDQLNEVKLKNYLGADFLEPATEAEVKELLGADFGSLGPVNLPENVKIIADRKVLPGGDTLIKYDIRFTQPNTAHLEMPTVHSIEHLSAEHMRNHTDRLIDFSPMGCQTGFYALTLGLEPEEFFPILEATLNDILNATEVPAANEVQCGWGANHTLEGAQAAAREFLAARDEWAQVMA